MIVVQHLSFEDHPGRYDRKIWISEGNNGMVREVGRGVAEADLDFANLTTIGRKSGLERTIEIWFACEGDTIYLLSGGGDSANWVRNLQVDDQVNMRLGRKTYAGHARLIDDPDEDAKARRLLAAKYQAWTPGKRLSSWARNSLAVAVDLRSRSSSKRAG